MSTDFFQEWRTADRAASTAERAVLQASMASIEGTGVAPSDEAMANAKRMRAIANDLFVVAMNEFAARSAQLRRRP